MKWHKKGVIYVADGSYGWAKTHAMIPTPDIIDNERIRIYVTFCDDQGIGRIGFVDISSDDPSRILAVSREPLLDIGLPGTFDENGVLVCSLLNLPNGTKYMYYVGFELGTKIRYRLFTGLAVSTDNGRTFIRAKRTPVLERSDSELYFRCGPFVTCENGLFRMWYVAGSSWTEIDGKSMPVYTIKYAESRDGITWPESGTVCMEIENENEHGFGRPYVVRDGGLYRMFYSIRTRQKGYCLGYAESADGIVWTRKDRELGLDPSGTGWDSEMICYSAVVEVKGRTYMFYNGNSFGKTGFGYAELEQ